MRHGRPMTLLFARLVALDERTLAGQKARFPGMKSITRFTRGSFHGFRAQPSDLARWICDTRATTLVRWLTCGRVYRSLGCDIR
jgi:hypothetical protein